MPFRITPSLGPDVSYIGGKPWFDNNASVPSPKIGTKVVGDDGHNYVFLQASANIGANAQVTITEPAMTAAAGTGSAYYTQGTAITSGQYFWARSTAQ